MSKIAITGCCGLLGQKLVRFLSKGNDVIGFDLLDEFPDKKYDIKYELVDIAELGQIAAAVKEYKPEYLINCAGITDVDSCEKQKGLAYMVNDNGVQNLVEACGDSSIKLIQLSTDYIFDGENGPFSEEDKPNPLGYYGITKLNAEKVIRNELKNYIIVRTNVLYGTGVDLRKNFVDWVLGKIQEGKSLPVVTDQYNNPTLADNLAEAIAELISIDFRGVIHFGGKDYLSRYKFAKAIAEVFSLNADLIQPILTEELKQRALRPLRGGVKTDKAEKILKTKPLSVRDGLRIVKEQIELELVD